MSGSSRWTHRPRVYSLMGLLLLRLSAETAVLEPMAWAPGENTPPAEAHGAGPRFPAPFSGENPPDRHVWDHTRRQDVYWADGYWLEWTFEAAEAFRGATLYLETPAGWHAIAPEPGDRRERLWLPFARFEPPPSREDLGGLKSVRLSLWNSGRGVDGAVSLHALTPARARVGLVLPDKGMARTGERGYVLRVARWLENLFTSLNVATALFPDTALAELTPGQLAVLVIPHLPEPDEEMLRALREQVRAGTKLMVFFNAHPGLAAISGVRALPYLAASAPGQWHDLWIEYPPLTVVQSATPHLIPVEPANRQGRIFAAWRDQSGAAQAEAGVVLTPRRPGFPPCRRRRMSGRNGGCWAVFSRRLVRRIWRYASPLPTWRPRWTGWLWRPCRRFCCHVWGSGCRNHGPFRVRMPGASPI